MKKFPFFAVVFVLIVVGLSFYLLSSERFDKKSFEPELQIALGNFADSQLYKLSDGSLTRLSLGNKKSLVSRSRKHDIKSSISVVMDPNELGNFLLLETEEGGTQLTESLSIKDTPIISFDGSFVAFSKLNLPFGTSLYSEEIADWDIIVMNVATGAIRSIGTGFRPHFASQSSNTLIYSTPDGIVQHNIDTDEKLSLLPGLVIVDTTQAAHVSPDGAYVASYNQTTETYGVFSILGEFPFRVSAVGEPSRTFEFISLDTTSLYGISTDQETNEQTLWQYSFDSLTIPFVEGERIYVFAKDQLPYQIIP